MSVPPAGSPSKPRPAPAAPDASDPVAPADRWSDPLRLRTAIDSAGLGLFDLDLVTGALEWTARTRELHGVPPDAAIDRTTLSQRVHPEDVEPMRELIAQAAREPGGIVEAEYRTFDADGKLRWVAVRGQMAGVEGEGEARRGTRFVGTAQDVTARRDIERQLDEEHAWLTLALEAGQMGIWEWNFRTGERRWNAAMYALYGVPPGGMTRQRPPYVEEILAEDAPRLQEEVKRLRARGGASQVEFRVRRRDDGRVRWISSRGVIRIDPSDGSERMFGVSYDITDRKANEQRLIEADRRKDEFLAMLAHELRNPLAPLTYAHRLLARLMGTDPQAAHALQIAERQAAQLRHLVDDLLEVARINRGRIELHPQPMDARQAVRDAAEAVLPLVQERRQSLAQHLPDEPVELVADPLRIAQVLHNLLHNASKYTPEGGRLRIELDARAAEIELRVTDDGVGIEAEQLGIVFDLFTQVGATLDRSQGGLGIGLALVKRLVELHGGSVVAASEGRGQGATFTVRLPRQKPHGDGTGTGPAASPAMGPTLAAGGGTGEAAAS